MEFLQNAQRHHHEHVGKIARALLQSLRECIDEGDDVLAASPLSQTDQRLEALATIAGPWALLLAAARRVKRGGGLEL